jgi:hypothetical protein
LANCSSTLLVPGADRVRVTSQPSQVAGCKILGTAGARRYLLCELVAAMGRRVTIRGEVVVRGGIQFLVIQSWQRN